MKTDERLPPGTKQDILKLLVKQELSAKNLADRLGVSATAIRQHLDTLRALGLVERRKLVTRPSRPTFLYRLSSLGQRAFPKRYDLLLGLVVEALLERYGSDGLAAVVEAAARRLAEQVRGRFERSDGRGRWELLVGWLEGELAWQADVSAEPEGGRRITIHQCPFQEVSRAHPAVCGVFFGTLIRTLYGEVPVEHAPAAGGPACCSLRIAGGAGPAPR